MRILSGCLLSLGWFVCLAGEMAVGQVISGSAAVRSNATLAQTGREDTVPADSTSPLTVMTWNLEWFYDEQTGDNFSKLAKEKSTPSREQWDWRRDAFARSIASVRPTVLAVQEVENRRVLWYLSGALRRLHQLQYAEYGIEGRDFFTEQDVGFLLRPPADLISLSQLGYPKRLRDTNEYYDVTKHLVAEIEFQHGEQFFPVLILNVHLRAKPEGEPFRIRQARLMHRWLREAIRSGRDVIVLGDFNSEETGASTRASSELGIACGLENADPSDDLIDLNLRLPADQRQTHLLPGRQYDRILCSRSLLEDDPNVPDLVFTKIEVLRELAVQGGVDDPQQHWEAYWQLPEDERDLSDHFPVMATFEVR